MTAQPLSKYFSLNRRYARSINLERDLDKTEAILGYVPTERAVNALRRILIALAQSDAPHAWTLTGVYGTGKSAFAHFLTALFAAKDSPVHKQALKIARSALGSESPEYAALLAKLPKQGLFRAVAAGQREPLSHTIIRALDQGASTFWKTGRQPAIASKLTDWAAEILCEQPTIGSHQIPNIIQEVAKAAKTDVLLVIDELGKNLEFTAQHQAEDLYLLQQLSERSKTESNLYLVALLHQSFADYGHRLAASTQSEWAKIQGRFEDIPFTESAVQLTRLIGEAINHSQSDPVQFVIYQQAEVWSSALKKAGAVQDISSKVLADAYPLHPVTAIVLPMLCTRYAQNDRSLFTFLNSAEPHSFQNFLATAIVQDDVIPTLKLHQIYDYFVEAVGTNLASRTNFQRWSEVYGLIADASYLDSDSLRVLKTIGTLNLVTATGAVRASRELVMLAMSDRANYSKEKRHWQKIIDDLRSRGLVTYRQQLDELRIWQGSDFDVEAEIAALIEKERLSLAEVLGKYAPLQPLIVQRHSYRTGTLRYFERRYLSSSDNLESLSLSDRSADGLIGYWIDERSPTQVPAQILGGQPLVILSGAKIEKLQTRALEYAALKKLQTGAIELLNDGVARREVRYRLLQAKHLLDEALRQTFDITSHTVWVQGEPTHLTHTAALQATLSKVCDRVYDKGWILWNELINRRELTSQGAKARRVLLESMLGKSDQEGLGLQGNGPEVSMYASLLGETGIHRQVGESWGFYPPERLEVSTVWNAIVAFCKAAHDQAQSLDQIYCQLEAPPYGMKRGAIPVMLAAVLFHCAEDISVYKDGTFVPLLGSEHFELLVKDPSRFAVKYIGFVGLRAQVFQQLEKMLRGGSASSSQGVRNGTLLSVVKPLFQFVRKLPSYTTKTTTHLSPVAQAVVQAILQAQEPDKLLFTALPQACKVSPISGSEVEDSQVVEQFCQRLLGALQEMKTAYDRLLEDCQKLLYESFGVSGDKTKLREDLRVRSRHLVGQCVDPVLKRFTVAAVEERKSDHEWVEALVMVVADKPAESWGDEDFLRFGARVQEVARKFKNLEALRADVAARSREGFEVQRVTLMRPDGREVNRLVWMDQGHKAEADDAIAEILAWTKFRDNPQLQEVLAARLAEMVLGEGERQPIGKPKPVKRRKLS